MVALAGLGAYAYSITLPYRLSLRQDETLEVSFAIEHLAPLVALVAGGFATCAWTPPRSRERGPVEHPCGG